MENNSSERWLPAAFHENIEVSDTGKVRYADSQELLPLRKGADGYIYADLDLPIHYLVVAAWQPHVTGKPLVEGQFKVIHDDGDTTNNSSYNLVAVPL